MPPPLRFFCLYLWEVIPILHSPHTTSIHSRAIPTPSPLAVRARCPGWDHPLLCVHDVLGGITPRCPGCPRCACTVSWVGSPLAVLGALAVRARCPGWDHPSLCVHGVLGGITPRCPGCPRCACTVSWVGSPLAVRARCPGWDRTSCTHSKG